MPYIPHPDREKLDPHIDALVKQIVASLGPNARDGAMWLGTLNYCVTKLMVKAMGHMGHRYHTLAMIAGVLSNVSSELYRRCAAPYEDRAADISGDIEEFQEWER